MPNLDIADVRAEIAVLRAAPLKMTWGALADRYQVNKGLLWRIAERGHEPKDATVRQRLGMTAFVAVPPCPDCGQVHVKGHPLAEQRRGVRLVTQVPDDWRQGVREAAAAEGITVSEWMRRVIGEALQLEAP